MSPTEIENFLAKVLIEEIELEFKRQDQEIAYDKAMAVLPTM